jgi:hypothetical protein
MRINLLAVEFALFVGISTFGQRAVADYSPTLGRWMEEDSVVYRDGLNFYICDGANPAHYLDPGGTCASCTEAQQNQYNKLGCSSLTEKSLSAHMKMISDAMSALYDYAHDGNTHSLDDFAKHLIAMSTTTGYRSPYVQQSDPYFQNAVNETEHSYILLVSGSLWGLSQSINGTPVLDTDSDAVTNDGFGDAWAMMEFERLKWLTDRLNAIDGDCRKLRNAGCH